MDNAKPFYLSLTIVGALIHLFITLAALFGVDLGDQAGAISKTIEQCTLAGASLLATFSTIVGRIRASKSITLRPPPTSVNMLLVLAAVLSVGVLSACARTNTSSNPPPAAATVTNSSPASSSVTSSQLANVGWTVANYLQTLNNGTTIPTVDQALAATHNSGDIATVNLVAALVGQVASAVVAAHNAGASTTQTQAVVNTVLAPAAVAQVASNVAATTPSSN
jgi:hypothetical protein